MAIVEHLIKGHIYLYDHHRVGKKIVASYLGRKDKISFPSSISAVGYPVSSKSYTTSHRKTDVQELAEYGAPRFKQLEDAIKKMPAGELAGTHKEDRSRQVSSNLRPRKLQGQVLRHEFIEDRLMHGRRGGKGVRASLKEFKAGKLRSSSGKKVTSRKQAIAIGISQERA